MAQTYSDFFDPASLSEAERKQAQAAGQALARLLEGAATPVTLHISQPSNGEEVEVIVPVVALQLLAQTLKYWGEGTPTILVTSAA